MELDPTTTSLQAAVVLLLLKEVFIFIKWWKTSEQKDHLSEIVGSYKKDLIELKNNVADNGKMMFESTKKLDFLHDQSMQMYDWHNKSDADGIKIWYVRRSLEDAIQKLADNVSVQTEVLRDILTQQKETQKDMERLEKTVGNVSEKLPKV